MPISDKDREIWRMAMQDVKPIKHDQVPHTTHSYVHFKPITHVNHTWDLHGMTLTDAHEKVQAEINRSINQFKYMTFITGKSGQMKQEFAHWVSSLPHVSRCEPDAHGGSFKVYFKKARK